MVERKIDRTFVAGMQADSQNSAIVRSSIELGHNLGMSTMAEGVEVELELIELMPFGCDHVQGYRISNSISLRKLLDADCSTLAQWPSERKPGAAKVESQ